ncbi:ankyrin repeat domain-containing protein 66 [Rhinatrema bivittatum]|uniref:ankyrin repeat domain-containing protein 66 n=1 Tax=Rhinatrema bivittatum TaxID=194408 RepID=UPI00112C3203|nr:ankyrin repeat domain-containing protein 66 [Rhinatrema bivittatum]
MYILFRKLYFLNISIFSTYMQNNIFWYIYLLRAIDTLPDMTELHEIAALGDYDKLEELLKKGIYDPNYKDADWSDKTALHWVAAIGKNDVLRLLLDKGARPCLRTVVGWTPAHFAAQSGKLGVLRILHSVHAPIDVADFYGDTPKRIAEIYGNKDCVEFLDSAEEECKKYRLIAKKDGFLLDENDEDWEMKKKIEQSKPFNKNLNEKTSQVESVPKESLTKKIVAVHASRSASQAKNLKKMRHR